MNITIEGMLNNPDVKVRPLFPTLKEYRDFRSRYVESVTPELKRLAEARRRSEHESRFRKVD